MKKHSLTKEMQAQFLNGVPYAVHVLHWRVNGKGIVFVNPQGEEVEQKIALQGIADACGLTSQEIADEIGSKKRTVQSWRSGQVMGPQAGLALMRWLSSTIIFQGGKSSGGVPAPTLSSPTLSPAASEVIEKAPTKAPKKKATKKGAGKEGK